MAFPTTGTRADSKLWKWKKLLGVLQNLSGALPGNDPKRGDTLNRTKVKLLRALNGVQSVPTPSDAVTADSIEVTVDSTVVTADDA